MWKGGLFNKLYWNTLNLLRGKETWACISCFMLTPSKYTLLNLTKKQQNWNWKGEDITKMLPGIYLEVRLPRRWGASMTKVSPCKLLRKQQRLAHSLGFLHTGAWETSRKLLAPSFALAQLPVAAIWGVNQQIEDLSLHLLCLCKSDLSIQ